MEVIEVPIADLKPAPYNPRKATKQEHDNLAESVKRFGMVDPIIVNSAPERKNIVIGGHFRLRVAESIGLRTVPVVYVSIPEESKERELNLRLNRNTGEWDWAELANFEESMLTDIGFGEEELDRIFVGGKDDEPGIDNVPKERATGIKPGDFFQLGEHLLLCGDATKKKNTDKLMRNEKAMLMATDPPYGIAYDNSKRPNPGVAKPRVAKPRVANDDLIGGKDMQKFLESMLIASLDVMKENAAYYFWHPMLTQGTYVAAAAAAAAAGILIHRQIIWVKPGMLLGRGDYHWRHELCFYGWRKGNRPPFYGKRNQDTIWEVGNVEARERKESNHPTIKPVALWDKPILNHTKRGQIVYEPFGGSGSSLIACEKLKRKCRVMEIVPSYCQVIIDRWEKLTGKRAAKVTS